MDTKKKLTAWCLAIAGGAMIGAPLAHARDAQMNQQQLQLQGPGGPRQPGGNVSAGGPGPDIASGFDNEILRYLSGVTSAQARASSDAASRVTAQPVKDFNHQRADSMRALEQRVRSVADQQHVEDLEHAQTAGLRDVERKEVDAAKVAGSATNDRDMLSAQIRQDDDVLTQLAGFRGRARDPSTRKLLEDSTSAFQQDRDRANALISSTP